MSDAPDFERRFRWGVIICDLLSVSLLVVAGEYGGAILIGAIFAGAALVVFALAGALERECERSGDE